MQVLDLTFPHPTTSEFVSVAASFIKCLRRAKSAVMRLLAYAYRLDLIKLEMAPLDVGDPQIRTVDKQSIVGISFAERYTRFYFCKLSGGCHAPTGINLRCKLLLGCCLDIALSKWRDTFKVGAGAAGTGEQRLYPRHNTALLGEGRQRNWIRRMSVCVSFKRVVPLTKGIKSMVLSAWRRNLPSTPSADFRMCA